MFWIFHQVYLGNNIPKSHIHYYSHQYHQPVKEKCIVTMATPSDIWDEFHLTLCLIFQVCCAEEYHKKPTLQTYFPNAWRKLKSFKSFYWLSDFPLPLFFSLFFHFSLSLSIISSPLFLPGGVLKFGLGRGVHAGDILDIGSRSILYQRPRFGAKQLMKLNQ